MSAITGIFYRNGRIVDPKLIKDMNNLLSHRGPDGSHIWLDESIAMGHQMLWTTPESLHEKLPFYDQESGLIITADSRIDNREDLSKGLGVPNKVDVSDSYFILKAYQKWGEKCPEKLLGDFAFAIWDKDNEKLFCARDKMGIKPFYYYLSDKKFFFATELNGLINLKEIPHKLNESRIMDYLINIIDKEITFYEGILRLPAASSLEIDFNKAKKSIYWELDPHKETIMDSDEEYSQKFLEIFTEAVKCRMRSAFNVGSLLSGGLDSSSIVCTARKILAEENSNYHLRTFTGVFNDLPICDERNYVDTILATGNLKPYFVRSDQISPLSEIDSIIDNIGEPFYVPSLYLHRELFKKAHNKGVRILLDGYDGDSTVFYGERYVLDLVRDRQLKKLLTEIYFLSKKYRLNPIQIFLLSIGFPLSPEPMLKLLQNILDSLNIDLTLIETGNFELLNENLVDNVNLRKRFQYFNIDPLKRAETCKLRHHYRLTSGFLQYSMEIANTIASKFNIESRYPFFDVRLVEFCLSLPNEQKYSRLWDRIIMRRAMENILPSEVQWRVKKTGVGMNFRRNMLLFDQKLLENSIFENGNLIGDYVNLKYLNNLYEKYSNEGKEVEPLNLWLSTVLIRWLMNKTFTD
jgi:asparagine synthase (glutamine-hydrolysing)